MKGNRITLKKGIIRTTSKTKKGKNKRKKKELEENNWNTEAAARKCSMKKMVFLKFLQNSHENTCVGVSFLQLHWKVSTEISVILKVACRVRVAYLKE